VLLERTALKWASGAILILLCVNQDVIAMMIVQNTTCVYSLPTNACVRVLTDKDVTMIMTAQKEQCVSLLPTCVCANSCYKIL